MLQRCSAAAPTLLQRCSAPIVLDGDGNATDIRDYPAPRPAEQIRDVYLRQSSMRLLASAEDVANTILFLTSDEGGVISGQAIGLDGHTETLANWLD